jgi:hypothetical protein
MCVLLMLLSVPSAAQNLAGSYTSKDLQLTVAPDPANANAFGGTITFNGVKMPLRATAGAGGLSGEFESGGNKFPFTLARDGDFISLTSGGTTYLLQPQAAAPANPIAPIAPPAPNPLAPQPGAQPNPPAAGNGAPIQMPAFFKPGMRITYQAGDSVVHGVTSKLVPNPNGKGGYIDPKTGQTYDDSAVRNSGGMGILQLNVLVAKPNFVAMGINSYFISDLQQMLCSPGAMSQVNGDQNRVGDFWVNPAALAQMQEKKDLNGTTIIRAQLTQNGRTYNAITIDNNAGDGFTHHTYDLETGLLLFGSTSSQGATVPTLGPNNTVNPGAGARAISHMQFMGVREVKVPWANEAPPAWVARGGQLNYQGSYYAVTQSGPLPPLGLSAVFNVADVTDGTAVVQSTIRNELGPGLPPQDSNETRRYGSALLNGLWIGTNALRTLQANTILDDDPITRIRTIFAGIQGNTAVIVEQGPMHQTENAYDVGRGTLIGARTTRQMQAGQMQVGQTVYQLQLVGQR